MLDDTERYRRRVGWARLPNRRRPRASRCGRPSGLVGRRLGPSGAGRRGGGAEAAGSPAASPSFADCVRERAVTHTYTRRHTYTRAGGGGGVAQKLKHSHIPSNMHKNEKKKKNTLLIKSLTFWREDSLLDLQSCRANHNEARTWLRKSRSNSDVTGSVREQ